MAEENREFRFGISSSISGVDLGKLLSPRPHSTYFMKVAEDMPELELHSGDIIVVDRSLDPKRNDIVITTSRDNPQLQISSYSSDMQELQLWGVAIHVIRSLR